jgi:predicted lipoprotein with Yx(FWY)xxD motif
MAGSWHVIKIHTTAAGATGRAAALKVEHTQAGPVLASSRGLTLYYYSADKRHSGKSACTGTCATAWPPLAAPVKAPAGVRLPGRLGKITRSNGVKQVTLNGYPLYFYVGDKAPGQVKGNGIGRAWHVIKIKA